MPNLPSVGRQKMKPYRERFSAFRRRGRLVESTRPAVPCPNLEHYPAAIATSNSLRMR